MKKSDLIKILHGDVTLIDCVNIDEVASFEENDVFVYPHDIKNVLLEFLIGKYTADDLQKWSIFLTVRTEYISPGDPSNYKLMDYYEDMWYVVQRLSTPEIDGEITKERVKQYLSELLKYGNE